MFCIPVPRDHFETGKPWVVIAIAILDAMLLVPVLMGHSPQLFAEYGFIPVRATFLTCVSAMFLHIGFWHYAGNMCFFWIFGRKVEATLGHLPFLLLFLLSGIGGQALFWRLNPHSFVPCVGASGAISGIAGMYLILFPRDRFDLDLYLGWWRVKSILSDARFAVGAWIGEQLLLALVTMFMPFSSVAFWAHLGGFAVGAGLGFAFRVRNPPVSWPEFKKVELPSEDEMTQPNPLIGLNLTPPTNKLLVGEAEPGASLRSS